MKNEKVTIFKCDFFFTDRSHQRSNRSDRKEKNYPYIQKMADESQTPFDTSAFFACFFCTLAMFSIGVAVLEEIRYRHPETDRSRLIQYAVFVPVGVMVLTLIPTAYIVYEHKRVHPIAGIAVGAGLAILMIHFGLIEDAHDKKKLEKIMIGWSVTAGILVLISFFFLHRSLTEYQAYTQRLSA